MLVKNGITRTGDIEGEMRVFPEWFEKYRSPRVTDR